MPAWSPPALAAAFFIAIHYLLLRAASGQVEDRVGALLLELTAAVGIGCTLLFGTRGTPIVTTRTGMAFASGSGLAVAVASILTFTALRRHGPVASTGAIVLGGGVALSAVASPWLFGEAVTTRRIVGIVLGLAAMAVLSRE